MLSGWRIRPKALGRGGGAGQSVSCGAVRQHHASAGQLGPASVAVEVITAYLVTWRWRRCQPLSHGVGAHAVVFERVPMARASPDY